MLWSLRCISVCSSLRICPLLLFSFATGSSIFPFWLKNELILFKYCVTKQYKNIPRDSNLGRRKRKRKNNGKENNIENLASQEFRFTQSHYIDVGYLINEKESDNQYSLSHSIRKTNFIGKYSELKSHFYL